MKALKVILAAAAVAAALPVMAQTTSEHVRGKVKSLTGDVLVIQPSHGAAMSVNLAADWGVVVMKPVDVATIQPGSFIAIVSALLYVLSVQGIDYRSARVISAAIVQCGTNIVETDPAPAHSLASVLGQSESRSVVCIIVALISPQAVL